MKPELHRKWRPSAAWDLLRRTAHGRRPTDEEFAAAYPDARRVGILRSAADAVAQVRQRNEGLRGQQDAVRLAEEMSVGFVALHDPPEPADRLSREEEAEAVAVAERIASRPENRLGR